VVYSIYETLIQGTVQYSNARKQNSAAISHPSLLTACQMALAVISGLSSTCAVSGLVTHYDHRNLRKEDPMLRVGATGTKQKNKQQYSTVRYSTVQYSTVRYSTVQYSAAQYSTHSPWLQNFSPTYEQRSAWMIRNLHCP
jgi:hypothetical protein